MLSHLHYRLLKQKQNKKELHDAEFSNVLGTIQQFMCVLYLEIIFIFSSFQKYPIQTLKNTKRAQKPKRKLILPKNLTKVWGLSAVG